MVGSIVAALGGLAFILIGLGALFAPAISSAQYGLATTDRTALAFVRAVGARDIVLGMIVLLFLARRDRDAVALVLSVSVLAAAGDATAVKTGRSDAGLGDTAIHFGGAAALLAAAALLRSGR